MRTIRVYPLFFLVILALVILPVHATIPVYDRSTQVDQCTNPSCSASSLATNAGDTIMIHTNCWSSSGSDVATPTDSISTTYTRVVSQIMGGVDSIWKGTSSGGSDIVTVARASGCTNFSFSVDIYSFVTGLGVNNQDLGSSGGTTGSDTLTMIIQPNSFIYEAWDLSNGNSNCPTQTGGSGQSIRDTFTCFAVGGNRQDGVTMDRQYTNGGSTATVANYANGGGGVTWSHMIVELLATGASVTQVNACYGNCGNPAVTRVNTNSTKSINFNVSQTWFYENQITFPALIINETTSVACTYGSAQCPNSNTLIIGLWVTQTTCFNAIPFTASCPGSLVASGVAANPVKGLFTIPVNYAVFTGQWIAVGFSATRNGMQLNDTNTLVSIFNNQGSAPQSLGAATAQGTSKVNVYAWATGNAVTGGAIIPSSLNCNPPGDLVCILTGSILALTPTNPILGAIFFAFIYSMFTTVALVWATAKAGNINLPSGVYLLIWMGWFTFFALLVGAIWFIVIEILAVIIMFTTFFSSLAQGTFRHSGRSDA